MNALLKLGACTVSRIGSENGDGPKKKNEAFKFMTQSSPSMKPDHVPAAS